MSQINYVNPRMKGAPPLTWQRLKEVIDYDPLTGLFTWRISRKGCTAGKPAGCQFGRYRYIGIDGRRYRANRLAFFWMHGEWPDGDVDHRRHSAGDAMYNLRIASPSQNQANSGRPKNNTSGFKGVGWSRAARKWRAFITVNHKQRHLGLFETKTDAAIAYNKAALVFFGSFAVLNAI